MPRGEEMPEYLAPGVYVEETSFRSKSIEGVNTTTTGFLGPARYRPVDLEPEIITSLGEFERVYGDCRQLKYNSATFHNYLWHAARSFFEEGGKRLYISRVFRPLAGTYPPADLSMATQTTPGLYDDGHARASFGGTCPSAGGIHVRSRFPGAAGNMRVRLTVRLGKNILGGTTQAPTVGALSNDDVVWIGDATFPLSSPPGAGTLYLAEFDTTEQTWRFQSSKTRAVSDLRLKHPDPLLSLDPERGAQVRVATVTVTVLQHDGGTLVWEGLPPDPDHQSEGALVSLKSTFASESSNLAQKRTLPIVLVLGNGIADGLAVVDALVAENPDLVGNLNNLTSSDADRSVTVELSGGNDGQRPTADDYRGESR